MTRPTFQNLYEELFYLSLLIRRFEEKIIELYPSDKIQSPVHLSIGQEAVAAGVCHDLRAQDWLFGSYRSHAFYIAKGGDLCEMMAELYGKATGCSGGKAGSMHLSAKEAGFMGASAVVAATLPHAVGAALAAKFRKLDQIIVAVFGDGATDEGIYHEALNLASLKKVPVIFVCENNGLAVHSERKARQTYDILENAATYGLSTAHLAEGWCPVKVRSFFLHELDQIRKDGLPRFVQIDTFRYKEHVGPGDDWKAGYRSREMAEAWQANDPLIQDKALIAKFDPPIQAEIHDAVAFAESSPWPGVADLLKDVY